MAADFAAVKAMHEAMSPNNAYLRFFSISRLAAEQEARRVTREPDPTTPPCSRCTTARSSGSPATRLSRRRAAGPRRSPSPSRTPCTTGASRRCCSSISSRWPAPASSRRSPPRRCRRTSSMLRVFSDAGLPVASKRGTAWSPSRSRCRPTTPAGSSRTTWTRWRVRERSANVASLRPVFAPGVGRGDRGEPADRARSAGRCSTTSRPAVHRAGSTRSTRTRGQIGGVPCFPDVASLPETPDLALLAVPPTRCVDDGGGVRHGAACAASSCSPRPSTRRSAPTCSPSAAGTGCG